MHNRLFKYLNFQPLCLFCSYSLLRIPNGNMNAGVDIHSELIKLAGNTLSLCIYFRNAYKIIHMNKLSLWFNCRAGWLCCDVPKDFLGPLVSPFAFSDGGCTIDRCTRSRSSTCNGSSGSGSSTGRVTCSSWKDFYHKKVERGESSPRKKKWGESSPKKRVRKEGR